MRAISDETFAAITILSEAEGESHDGKIAVAEVIRNRMRQRFFSDGTVIGTCFLRLQFSVWNDDPMDNRRAVRMLSIDDCDPRFLDALTAWRESGDTSLVPYAVQYYNPKLVHPAWAGDFDWVRSIGNHSFLKRKNFPPVSGAPTL